MRRGAPKREYPVHSSGSQCRALNLEIANVNRASFANWPHLMPIDIVVKLCDLEFWRKAKAADLLTEIWDKFRAAGAGSGDKVRRIILC